MSVRGRAVLGAVALVMVVASLAACEPPPPTTTFHVRGPGGGPDANPGDGLCADAGGTCSLLAAMQEAESVGRAELIVPDGDYGWIDATVRGHVRINPSEARDVRANLNIKVQGHLALHGVTADGAMTVSGSLFLSRSTLSSPSLPLEVAEGARVALDNSIVVSGREAMINRGTVAARFSTLYSSDDRSPVVYTLAGGATYLWASVMANSAGTGACSGSAPISLGYAHVELPCDGGSTEGMTTGPAHVGIVTAWGENPSATIAASSPLVDAVPSDDPVCTGTDLSGSSRGVDGNSDSVEGCDIGAVERQPSATATGSISGLVTEDGDGTPIGGVTVRLNYWDPATVTGPDGHYTLANVTPGGHRVHFDGAAEGFVNEYYDDSLSAAGAELVVVGPAETVDGIDAGLALGGAITGRLVSDGDGSPLPGILVAARVGGDSTEAFSGPEGSFTLVGMRPGAHVVSFTALDGSVVGEYYDNSRRDFGATPVTVLAGETVDLGDVGLLPRAPVQGRVTAEETGEPVVGALVTLWTWGGVNIEAVTGPDGRYVVEHVSPDSYHVTFRAPTGNPQNLVGEYWGGTWGLAGAAILEVTWEGRSDVDGSLATGGSISGQVTRADDATPVPDARVAVAFDAYESGVTTDEFGRYEIRGVPAGPTTLQVTVPADPNLLPASIPVDVAAGAGTSQDVSLEAGSTAPDAAGPDDHGQPPSGS